MELNIRLKKNKCIVDPEKQWAPLPPPTGNHAILACLDIYPSITCLAFFILKLELSLKMITFSSYAYKIDEMIEIGQDWHMAFRHCTLSTNLSYGRTLTLN